MTESTFWLVVSGLLLVAEIITGTFYLMLIAVGTALGALAAYLELSFEVQIGTAAVFSTLAVSVLRRVRRRYPEARSDPQADKLDIGNLVEVTQWDANGRSQVLYRGAFWQTQSLDDPPVPGLHRVEDVQSNILMLTLNTQKASTSKSMG